MNAGSALLELLTSAGLDAEPSEDRSSCSVVRGSARVNIHVGRVERLPLVEVAATVLERVEERAAASRDLLARVNAINGSLLVGHLVYRPEEGLIVLEHRFVGLPGPAELVLTVDVIARAVDEIDDRLRREIGTGRRAVGAVARLRRRMRGGVELPTSHAQTPPSPARVGDDALDV